MANTPNDSVRREVEIEGGIDWTRAIEIISENYGLKNDVKLAAYLKCSRASISLWRQEGKPLPILAKLRIFDALGYKLVSDVTRFLTTTETTRRVDLAIRRQANKIAVSNRAAQIKAASRKPKSKD